MAAPTRASLVSGPCRIVRGSASCYQKVDTKVTLSPKTLDLKTSSSGLIDKRWLEYTVNMPFTPDGKLTTDLLSMLWNDYANMGEHCMKKNSACEAVLRDMMTYIMPSINK